MKKLFASFFFPIPLTLALLAAGLLLVHAKWLKFPHSRLIGKIAIGLSALLFLLYSMYGWYPTMKLEYKCEPLHITQELADGAPYVVAVFGNSYIFDKTLPPTHRFQTVMSTRMFEAARVAHELQQLGIDYTIAGDTTGLGVSILVKDLQNNKEYAPTKFMEAIFQRNSASRTRGTTAASSASRRKKSK